MDNSDTIDVVICVHNALDDVKACVNSVLQSNCPGFSINIIIIDDGSADETKSYLQKITSETSSITVYRNEEAQGYTKAANKGLKRSTAPFIVLLNSDTILSQRAVLKMLRVLEEKPDVALVGPLSNAATWQSTPEVIGSDGKFAINSLPDHLNVDDIDELLETIHQEISIFPRVPLLNGFCTMFRQDIFEQIGYLDEDSFPQGYGEENDFCFRADDAGFGLVIATNTYVFHSKSKSFGHERREQLSKKGGAAFRDKYNKFRIKNSTDSLKLNPILSEIREKLKLRIETKQI